MIVKDISNKDNFVDEVLNYLSNENLNHFWLGTQDYNEIWGIQKEIHRSVSASSCLGVVLYLEHNNVYTLGKNSNSNHILPSKPKNIDVILTDRGGDVTYHGPGQLVGYPIINLKQYKKSVSWYMRSLENILINTLDSIGIEGSIKDGLTGVWVDDEKICAMGVRMAKWTSMHGFALNVNTDLSYYNGLIPCGIFEYGITSIKKLINSNSSVYEIADVVALYCNNIFNKYKVMEKNEV